jgi:hypothetical protein
MNFLTTKFGIALQIKSTQLCTESDIVSHSWAVGKEELCNIFEDEMAHTCMIVFKIKHWWWHSWRHAFEIKSLQSMIGTWKFASLSPKHVVSVSAKDHNICCYRCHEYVRLIWGSCLIHYQIAIELTIQSAHELLSRSANLWKCKDIC